MTMDHLTKLKIKFSGDMGVKSSSKDRIAATSSLGQNELWSSANLYRHLQLLENLVPKKVR
jgi:hypothetical protein